MIYITGDTHGDFKRIREFCEKNKTNKEDLVIVLGDSGINFFLDKRDGVLKSIVSQIPVSFLFVHGNHEERAERVDTYKGASVVGNTLEGIFLKDRSNQHFANMFQIVKIGGKDCLIVGGACSPDKEYRIKNNLPWFESEELTEKEEAFIRKHIKFLKKKHFAMVLTHTCPLKYEPKDLCKADQSKISKRTEKLLDELEDNLNYDKWFCGHWHTDRQVDDFRFVYEDIIEIGERL